MNDEAKPLEGGLTPPGYDEYGDGEELANTPEQVRETQRRREAARERDEAPAPVATPEDNPGKSPLG